MFEKILVANRGEIAVRVIATARRMGIKTVAIYSEADTNSLHVHEADEAVYVGPSPSAKSYLNVKSILSAIRKSGSEAVHPGYGFLSENADFARAVERDGVAFIGPGHQAILSMGDKIEAKKIAKKAGVNILPGTLDAISNVQDAAKIAKKIGYPVIVKAAAGGGGKGMRIVHNENDLKEALRAAASEASSSFKDSRVFIEKYIQKPRHIEIQIIADSFGNVLSLGERECSIQRRHQKILEEAPSPFLDVRTRKAMSAQAVALAKEAGYVSAGTVEFIVDEQKNFYFLEMNTRLQVEHRVTELVTGLDLVELMIRIANGEALPLKQGDVKTDGWALEARVYSEDPARGFLPSVGRITRYQEPEEKNGVIVDSGVYEGAEVNIFYDPMIAKVCSHGSTREKAVSIMSDALSRYVIKGVAHNISFLEAIVNHERFKKGDISTNFITEEYPGGFLGAELNSENTRILLAAAVCIHLRAQEREDTITGQISGRGRPLGARWVVNISGDNYYVFVSRRDTGYDIAFENEIISVRSGWEPGLKLFHGIINGKSVSVKFENEVDGYRLTYAGSTAFVLVQSPRVAELYKYMPAKRDSRREPVLKSPMAGMILSIKVKEGELVKTGQPIILIEAMKMENAILAEYEATITKVCVNPGASVQVDQTLVEFDS